MFGSESPSAEDIINAHMIAMAAVVAAGAALALYAMLIDEIRLALVGLFLAAVISAGIIAHGSAATDDVPLFYPGTACVPGPVI